MENLIGDEMPPEWMWPLDHEIEDWFKEIERKRKEKYSSTNSSNETEESGPMMENEYSKSRRGGRYAK